MREESLINNSDHNFLNDGNWKSVSLVGKRWSTDSTVGLQQASTVFTAIIDYRIVWLQFYSVVIIISIVIIINYECFSADDCREQNKRNGKPVQEIWDSLHAIQTSSGSSRPSTSASTEHWHSHIHPSAKSVCCVCI